MKFMIQEKISYNEIYQSIAAYRQANHGKNPAYIMIHPETRHNIMISSQEENNGISYTVIQPNFKNDDSITAQHTMFGLYLIQTYDVEPGFMIIAG